MHKQLFCQKLFDTSLGTTIHKARKACLSRFIGDLLDYDINLSVTEIGKKLSSSSTVKSKIQAANYLIGNKKLASQIPLIYKGLFQFFWGGAKELVLLVDWSGACSNKLHVLTASVVGHGRSVPIYHQIFTESELGSKTAHEQFLKTLHAIIPIHIKVTLITDAGFPKQWFKEVLLLGWDVIGRLYQSHSYRKEGEESWHTLKDISFGGTGIALTIGKVTLGKTTEAITGYLYTYKEKLSGKPHKKNKYPDHERQYSQYYKKGWILFSSLNKSSHSLVKYYKKRMQIEQNFRDIKNEQLGIGLRQNHSYILERISMLWLIAILIIILSWWFGLVLERQNKQWAYQANTVKNKRVRSLVHLARLVYRHEPHCLDWEKFIEIIPILTQQYDTFIDLGILF